MSTAPKLLDLHVVATGIDERTSVLLDERQLSLGRDAACDVALPSATVSRRHLSLFLREGRLMVRDHSSNGTQVDGAKLHLAVRELGRSAALQVGPYAIALTLQESAVAPALPPALPAASLPESALLEPASAPESQVNTPAPSAHAPEAALRVSAQAPEGASRPLSAEASVELRRSIRAQLLDSLDLVALERGDMDDARMRPRVIDALDRIMTQYATELPMGEARLGIRGELCDEVLGLGPLEPLLRDPSVSEIMVVDAATIYVERAGRIERSLSRFTDDTAVRAALERIVTPLGRRIDESSPIVDARLKDGSRVNAIIPPLAIKGPCITIRKFPSQRLTLEQLIERGSISAQMASFLSRAVRLRVNLVIAGGTGSGKTTLLNVLSAVIPAHERIVTIEDAAELSLAQPHVVSLESRPANMEGAGAVTIRDLVKNALRMRPDRILVGECRGGEALDMLQAMNTGHDGSMTTTHANSPVEAVQRLETLCLMSGIDLPLMALRRQIAASVELLVQQARFADGSRRITRITEVVGLDDHGELELRDLFSFEQTGTEPDGRIVGEYRASGSIPRCVARFVAAGIVEPGACF
jgi:pilus assembly protein CpaF